MGAEGFAMIPNWLIRETNVSVYGIAVYAALASHNGRGGIYPSIPTIAREARCSERKVQYELRELVKVGALVIEKRRTARGDADTSVYHLRTSLEGGAPGAPGGAYGASPVVHDMHQGGAHGAPKEEPLEEEPLEEGLSPDESDDQGTLIPADWRPNQRHIDKAGSLHLDVVREYHRFRDNAERTHRRLKNWNSGFTNWLTKCAEYAQQRQGRAPAMNKAQQRQADNLAVVAQMAALDAAERKGLTA
jgi:hypothetical protein